VGRGAAEFLAKLRAGEREVSGRSASVFSRVQGRPVRPPGGDTGASPPSDTAEVPQLRLARARWYAERLDSTGKGSRVHAGEVEAVNRDGTASDGNVMICDGLR